MSSITPSQSMAPVAERPLASAFAWLVNVDRDVVQSVMIVGGAVLMALCGMGLGAYLDPGLGAMAG